jgi:cytochrome c556
MKSARTWTQRIRIASLMVAGVLFLTAAAAAATPPISTQARQGIVDAMTAEYKAMALYKAVAARHKDSRPFTNWAQADRGDDLRALFARYGVTLPADTFAGKTQAPASVAAACKSANQTETGLVALYERLLKTVKEADVGSVFTSLRDGSKRRLGALERQCD